MEPDSFPISRNGWLDKKIDCIKYMRGGSSSAIKGRHYIEEHVQSVHGYSKSLNGVKLASTHSRVLVNHC